jgi:hypothetical protein
VQETVVLAVAYPGGRAGPAQQPRRRRIAQQEGAVVVDDPEPFVHRVDDGGQQLGLLGGRPLRGREPVEERDPFVAAQRQREPDDRDRADEELRDQRPPRMGGDLGERARAVQGEQHGGGAEDQIVQDDEGGVQPQCRPGGQADQRERQRQTVDDGERVGVRDRGEPDHRDVLDGDPRPDRPPPPPDQRAQQAQRDPDEQDADHVAGQPDGGGGPRVPARLQPHAGRADRGAGRGADRRGGDEPPQLGEPGELTTSGAGAPQPRRPPRQQSGEEERLHQVGDDEDGRQPGRGTGHGVDDHGDHHERDDVEPAPPASAAGDEPDGQHPGGGPDQAQVGVVQHRAPPGVRGQDVEKAEGGGTGEIPAQAHAAGAPRTARPGREKVTDVPLCHLIPIGTSAGS